jgi:hypothetical protein
MIGIVAIIVSPILDPSWRIPVLAAAIGATATATACYIEVFIRNLRKQDDG